MLERAYSSKITKAEFLLVSTDEITLSDDEDNASIITGLSFEFATRHWKLEAGLGGVRNVSGRKIKSAIGIYSAHEVSVNAAAKVINVFSERSSDAVLPGSGIWIKNDLSGRSDTISINGTRSETKSSEAFDVKHNEVVRFRVFASGSGISFSPVQFTANGDIVICPSFRWRLREV